MENFISKFILKRKELVKKFFIAFKNYVNENKSKERNIINLNINYNDDNKNIQICNYNANDINKDLIQVFKNNNKIFLENNDKPNKEFENNNQIFLENNDKPNKEFEINKKIEVDELVLILDSKHKSKTKESYKNKSKEKDININSIDDNRNIQNSNNNASDTTKNIENPNIDKIMDITNSLECLIIHLKNLK